MHDTSECKVMLQQANKLRQSWKAQPKKFAQCKSGNPNQTEEPQEEANQMLKKPSKSGCKHKIKVENRQCSEDFDSRLMVSSVHQNDDSESSSSSE
jgi:hypothetical protein